MEPKVISAAERTLNIRYAIRDITVLAGEVAKTGKEMLYLNIGDPNVYDFETPGFIIDKTYEAMKRNRNGYSPSSGIQEARDAIVREAERKGITSVRDCFVTTGASEAIEICLTALVNAGENFLTPTPGYPLYTAIASKLQAEENQYFLDEEKSWEPDLEDIRKKINEKTRAIVIINPNNPTGSVASRETLLELIKIAKEHNLVIFADEIYDKLLLGDKEEISIASLNKEVPVVTLGGFSKNYLAPGFRIGWATVSGDENCLKDYLAAINRILRSRLSANHPEQYAIAPALDGQNEHLERVRAKLRKRCNLTYEIMNSIDGISLVEPMGAFYAFPKLNIKNSDNHFVSCLLKETGVVVVPGSGFGQRPGQAHFRIVFLPPEEVLEKAYAKIRDFVAVYMDRYEGKE